MTVTEMRVAEITVTEMTVTDQAGSVSFSEEYNSTPGGKKKQKTLAYCEAYCKAVCMPSTFGWGGNVKAERACCCGVRRVSPTVLTRVDVHRASAET